MCGHGMVAGAHLGRGGCGILDAMDAQAAVAEPTTADLVYEVVAAVPPRRVLSYGDVAELAGLASARIVGRVLASGAEPVPWHRIVRADGTCAPHLRTRQLQLLRAEGTPTRGDRVLMARARFDPTRLERPASELDAEQATRWLASSIAPRPVAWVSVRTADGVDRLATHPVTPVLGSRPPAVCFIATRDDLSVLAVRDTGEFVVCVGTDAMLAAVNESSVEFPAATSTFDAVGLQREASVVVAPPRVAHTPVAFECVVAGECAIGGQVLVLGEVVHIACTRGVLGEDGLPDPVVLAPLGRLGDGRWLRSGQVVELAPVDWEQWQRGVRSAQPPARPPTPAEPGA